MRQLALGLVLAVMPLSAANAQNMPLSQFLDRATALEKKGAMALFSGDLKVLKKEMAASGKALGEERRAALKAGKKPAYCPPENQKSASMGAGEILGHLRSIPAAQRNQMRTKDGFRSLFARKYPCPS